jgi:hypothetical protein
MASLQGLHQYIGAHLVAIEDELQRLGLPLSKLTFIARDPSNDKMIVVLTNEDIEGLRYASDLAVKQEVVIESRE